MVDNLGYFFSGGCSAIYKGTANDPTTFPPPQRSAGSHHWTFERLLSAGLVPLTAAAFVTSGSHAALLDGLLGISLVVHSHIGVRPYISSPLSPSHSVLLLGCLLPSHDTQFDTILVDYVHKRKFPALGPILTWTLRVTSLAVGVGIYQFNTNDIGAFFITACLPVHIQLTQILRRSDGAHPPRMGCIGVRGRGIVSLP